MPAFRVVDTFPDHPKLERLADRPMVHALAVAAWVLLGSDCLKSDRRTDGRVSVTRIARVLPWPRDMRRRAAHALVECGLWTKDGDDYIFHDWADYQATSEQISADRKATANRQKRWRQQKNLARNGSESNGKSNGVTDTVTNPVTNADSHTVGNGTNARARDLKLQVQVKVPSLRSGGKIPPPPDSPEGTPEPESGSVLAAVCEGVDRRLSAHQAPPVNWTQQNLTHAQAIATWLTETQGADPIAACDRLLDLWFADAWVASHGFPLSNLANHPGRYFSGVLGASEALRAKANEALSEGDLVLYRSLMQQLRTRGGDDER